MTASDAFPALTPDQTERLRAVGTEEDAAAGDSLFREGDAGDDFFAILAGEVQIYMEARACDAATAVVVGGGNSAGQAAMFLSERFAHVRLLLRGGDLGKSMSHYLTSRIEAAPRIESNRYTEVHAVHGDGRLEGEALAGVTLADTRAGTTERVATPALFVFVGADPCTEWLRGAAGGLALSTDAHGFICTGSGVPPERLDAARRGTLRPDGFETSEPGVFAVGDVRSGSTKRVAGAVGEGSVTVKSVHSRRAAPPVTSTHGEPQGASAA